jgi:DNA-binding response OmpR family regulator
LTRLRVRTVLITDDNESVLHTLEYVLGLRGYRPLVANSGAVALEIAARETCDAALVDVHMPEMDGFALCRALRERAITAGKDIPVFMMTAMHVPAASKRALEAGAVTLLKKPFDCDEFLSRLERYCSGELPLAPLPASPPIDGDANAAPPTAA